jgi:hypothetical protein
MTRFLDIHRFDLRTVAPGSVLLVLGDRGTGKTSMSLEILHSLRKFPMGIVMAGSLDTVDEYKKHVPQTLIYDEYAPDALATLLHAQDQRLRQYGRAKLKPVFLVLDDLMYDKTKINNDPRFKKVILNGRHYNITVIICAQYVKHVSAELRPNIDYIFTTYQKNQEQRRKIRTEFDVGFTSDKLFHDTMLRCTLNWGCMVMDKRSIGRAGLHESVFYLKAQINRQFTVGPAKLWQVHKNKFNPHHYIGKAVEEVDTRRVIIRKIKPRPPVDWL